MGGLYQGLLSVLMTVKFEFAQTVALAVNLSNNCRRPLSYALTPVLAYADVPVEWINAIVNYITKFMSLLFAWTIQRGIVAYQSAVQGGQIFSSNVIELLNRNADYLDNLSAGFIKEKALLPIDPDKSLVDEVLGWTVAVCGLWFQLTNPFMLPFPFNIILFPLTLAEWTLEWVVTFAS